MSERHLHLISYDISANQPRARVLRELKAWAVGGQKSVYECWLDEAEFDQARERLTAELSRPRDRLVIIRLDTRAAVHTLGVGVVPQDGDYFYHG